MKRYIKIWETDEWIDTQAEHDNWGRYYYVETNENGEEKVYYYSDETGTDTFVGTLETQCDKFVVKYKVYTRYLGIFGDEEELSLEETNRYECSSYEKAEELADKDKEGWRGSFVEVYINNEFYRDYEVE